MCAAAGMKLLKKMIFQENSITDLNKVFESWEILGDQLDSSDTEKRGSPPTLASTHQQRKSLHFETLSGHGDKHLLQRKG